MYIFAAFVNSQVAYFIVVRQCKYDSRIDQLALAVVHCRQAANRTQRCLYAITGPVGLALAALAEYSQAVANSDLIIM